MMVIDVHSHIETDAYCGEMSIHQYLEFAKKSLITEGLLMLVPSPVELHEKSGKSVCAWTCDNGKVIRFGSRNPFVQHNYFWLTR